MRGKTIKLYIMDDELKHLKSAELSNWSGKAYIGQRKHVQLLKTFDELATPGIYFLFTEVEGTSLKKVYIGEADIINERLPEQHKAKDWWTDFVIFISKDSNLTKAHVRFLEKNFYELAIESNTTIELNNKNIPTGSKLPKPDCDDMYDFKDNAIYIMKNLGLVDFRTQLLMNQNKEEANISKLDVDFSNHRIDSNTFYMKIPNNLGEEHKKAMLKIVDDSYILMSGSYIRSSSEKEIATHNYNKLRFDLAKDGYFTKTDSEAYERVVKDIIFSSPSAAAAVARNASINGRKEWKLESGISLDEFENNM